MKPLHDDLEFTSSGLVVCLQQPWLAASPDSLINCTCHGPGVIEVKCPYKFRDVKIITAVENEKNFHLSYHENSKEFKLKTTHEYYYQIQLQMFVTRCTYGMFVTFTTCDFVYVNVPFDEQFFEKVIPHCKRFFMEQLLPEMVAKVSTTVSLNETILNHTSEEVNPAVASPQIVTNYLPCVCQKILPNDIEKILCVKEDCLVKEFHKRCTGLKRFSKNWICKACQDKQRRFKGKEKTLEKKRIY